MYWRVPHRTYERRKGVGNKRALSRMAGRGDSLGVIGYRSGEPIGWCSVAPREQLVRLANSRILRPLDAQSVWSITCLFVSNEHRQCGVSRMLIRGAVEFARRNGAPIVEAYPVDPGSRSIPPAFAFTGIASAFESIGFSEVARRSPTRPILRLQIQERQP
jgi:GNAT superfamily N-acetyltransferase